MRPTSQTTFRARVALGSVVALTLLAASACAPEEDDDEETTFGLGPEGEIECGELTCGSDEICIRRDPPPLGAGADGEGEVECAMGPSGCNIQNLCDCEETESTWEGDPITGCSILGSRELLVTDAACGSAPCAAGEGCIAFGSAYSNADLAVNNYCFPLPADCSLSDDFCDTDCAERLAEAAGETYSGCFSAGWGVAAMVVSE